MIAVAIDMFCFAQIQCSFQLSLIILLHLFKSVDILHCSDKTVSRADPVQMSQSKKLAASFSNNAAIKYGEHQDSESGGVRKGLVEEASQARVFLSQTPPRRKRCLSRG